MSGRAAEPGGGRSVVLVVERDATLRELLALVLGEAGHALRAVDPLAVDDGLRGGPVHLVLLNAFWYGPGAAAVVRAELGRDVPIIALTTRLVDATAAVGADAVLPMPFDVDELLRAVARFGE